MPLIQSKRVAIIGGGCTGITSFWALTNTDHDVHLFEASAQLGGRVKSLPFEHHENRVFVDTESPTFNAQASPNLVALLDNLGIQSSTVPFGFSVSIRRSTFQWGINTLKNILRRPGTLCSLETYRMLFDIIRFRYLAVDMLADDDLHSSYKTQHGNSSLLSVHEYLSSEGFSDGFRDKYLAPLASVLWRANVARLLPELPFKTLARLLHNHQLLGALDAGSQWRRIDVGASQFLQTMTEHFPAAKVHLQTRVIEAKQSGKGGYILYTSDGRKEHFNHVIFAVDSQETLRILHSIVDVGEREILRGLQTSKNVAVLHSDQSHLPETNGDAPAFHYIVSPTHHPSSAASFDSESKSQPKSNPPRACLTSNVNSLQNIPTSLFGHIAISINTFTPPHPRLVQGVWEYTDVQISAATLKAQSLLPRIQDKRGLSYCCSNWTGHGFYEDAVTVAFEIAVKHLGAEVPFAVVYHDNRVRGMALTEGLGIRDHLVRTVLRLARVYMLVFEILLVLLRRFRNISGVRVWGRGTP